MTGGAFATGVALWLIAAPGETSNLCTFMPRACTLETTALQARVWGGLRGTKLNTLLQQAYDVEQSSLAFVYPDPTAKKPFRLDNGQGDWVDLSLVVRMTGKPTLSAMSDRAVQDLTKAVANAGLLPPPLVPQDGRDIDLPSTSTEPNIKPYIQAAFLVAAPIKAQVNLTAKDGNPQSAEVDFQAQLLLELHTENGRQYVRAGSLATFAGAASSESFKKAMPSDLPSGMLTTTDASHPGIAPCVKTAQCSCDVASQIAEVATFVVNTIAMPALADRLAAHLNAISIFNMRNEFYDFTNVMVGQNKAGTFLRVASLVQSSQSEQHSATSMDDPTLWQGFEGSAADFYACVDPGSMKTMTDIAIPHMESKVSQHGSGGWCKCHQVLCIPWVGCTGPKVCIGGGYSGSLNAGLTYSIKDVQVLSDATVRFVVASGKASAKLSGEFCAGLGVGSDVSGSIQIKNINYDCTPTWVGPKNGAQGRIDMRCKAEGCNNIRDCMDISFPGAAASIVWDLLSATGIAALIESGVADALQKTGLFDRSSGFCVGMPRDKDPKPDPSCRNEDPYRVFMHGFETPKPKCLELFYQPQTMDFKKSQAGNLCVTGIVNSGAKVVDDARCEAQANP